MPSFEGCQLPGIPELAVGFARPTEGALIGWFKRMLAVPWNRHGKKWLKQVYYMFLRWQGDTSVQTVAKDLAPEMPLKKGDRVKVRSVEEITSTLDPFKELKGCAFLPEMYRYCGTEQRVLKSMQYFMDERDYKLKKVRGVVLLENVTCIGAPVFGPCDRCCFLFWREEWLEKVTWE